MAKSRPRMPMPVSERAKQFSPFSPLKGLEEALSEKERLREGRREVSSDLAEKLDRTLRALRPGQAVTAVYYLPERELYKQLTGAVTAVDGTGRTLSLGGERIPFDDLFDLEPIPPSEGSEGT